MQNTGSLMIRPLSAKLTKDTEFFGKMDPYCKFILGSSVLKSQVSKDGGKNPNWSDQISMRRNLEDIIVVEVWDSALGKDEFIGSGEIAFNSLLQNKNHFSNWVELRREGKNTGMILLEIDFVPDQTMLGKQQPMGMQAGLQQQPISTQSGYSQQPSYQQQQQQPTYQQSGYQQSGYQQPTGYQQTTSYQQPTSYGQPTSYQSTGQQQSTGYSQPSGYQQPGLQQGLQQGQQTYGQQPYTTGLQQQQPQQFYGQPGYQQFPKQ